MAEFALEALHELLTQQFDTLELRKLVYFATGGETAKRMPSTTLCIDDFAFECIQLLDKHGAIDKLFFLRLREARPQRTKEIECVEHLFEHGRRSFEKNAPGNSFLKVYRDLLRDEIHNNLVLELFERTDYESMCIQPRFQSDHIRTNEKQTYSTQQLLQRGQVVVVGEPGSGKTTALRLLTLDLLREESKTIPIYLPLASYSVGDNRQRFRNHVDEELSSLGATSLDDIETSALSVVLLLDGWDEVLGERERREIKKFLLRSEHPYILTTRPEAFRSAPSSERFTILGLGPAEIRDFASRRVEDDDLIGGFVDWIISDPDLSRLAANPLNLSIMLIVFSERSESGAALSRTELYLRAFDAIMQQHHRTQRTNADLDANRLAPCQLEAILTQIAYQTVIEGGGRFFTHKQLEQATLTVLGKMPQGLASVLSGRLGVIRNRRARGFEFFHLWYQEFLAARHLVASCTDIVNFFTNLNNASLLPFVVGLLAREGRDFATLRAVPIPDIFNFCRAIGESRVDHDKRAVLIGRALDYAQKRKLPVRIELALGLAQIGVVATTSLSRIAKDPARPDYHRRACLEAVQLLAPSSIAETLLVDLSTTRSMGLLWHVVEHIGNRKVADAQIVLKEYCEKSTDPILRADSTWALMQMGDCPLTLTDSQIDELIDQLGSDDNHVRGHALRSIGRLRLSEAVPNLAQYLEGESNAYRWIVPEAIASIGGTRAAELLVKALHDKDPKVVAAALEGIGLVVGSLPATVITPLLEVQGASTWITARKKTLGRIAWETVRKILGSQDYPSIVLCRHSVTEYNAKSILQGKTDTPISEHGKEIAREQARALCALPFYFERIVSSPLRRAMETAEIYADGLHIPVHIDSRLRELDHGHWEGSLVESLVSENGGLYGTWLRNPESVKIPGSQECATSVAMRVEEAMRAARQGKRGAVLIVGHKHALALGVLKLYSAPFQDFQRLIVEKRAPRILPDWIW